MTKPQNYYWGDHVLRKICDIREDANHNKHSCEHQPLLNIFLENVVLDELHLMLRITGIYYSAMMSFYHIRSREGAKYQAVIHCSVLV